MDKFTEGYLEAALWSSVDDDGTPLDSVHNFSDIADGTFNRMMSDCEQFQEINAALLAQTNRAADYDGHDFWLTRSRHGAGFWDGDLPKELGEALTAASHAFREFDLYIGDDGQIHGQ